MVTSRAWACRGRGTRTPPTPLRAWRPARSRSGVPARGRAYDRSADAPAGAGTKCRGTVERATSGDEPFTAEDEMTQGPEPETYAESRESRPSSRRSSGKKAIGRKRSTTSLRAGSPPRIPTTRRSPGSDRAPRQPAPPTPANTLTISRRKAGRSSGLRLLTSRPSTRTSSSTQVSPAICRSVFRLGHEVRVRPPSTPASARIHGRGR